MNLQPTNVGYLAGLAVYLAIRQPSSDRRGRRGPRSTSDVRIVLAADGGPALLPEKRIAGWSGLAAVLLPYLVRIRNEEATMLGVFGPDHQRSDARTGASALACGHDGDCSMPVSSPRVFLDGAAN